MSAQCRLVSQSYLVSSLILSIISVRVLLCLSKRPLLHGLYAAVVFTSMLNFSAMVRTSSLLNSPPLSLNRVFGGPWILIHDFMKCLMNSLGRFVLIMLPALKRVNMSIMCRYQMPLSSSCRSTDTVSLKSFAIGRLTAGLGGVCLYLTQTSHS